MTLLLVLAGGVIGAPLRYLTDLLVQSRHDSVFPWGTFTVNVVGLARARPRAGRRVDRAPCRPRSSPSSARASAAP